MCFILTVCNYFVFAAKTSVGLFLMKKNEKEKIEEPSVTPPGGTSKLESAGSTAYQVT
jgi:hypothetical protein